MLEPLLRERRSDDWLDPQAVGRVENRLRHHGRPPRTVDEMAERLRLLGDLTPSETRRADGGIPGRAPGQGRAVQIELAWNPRARALDPGRR